MLTTKCARPSPSEAQSRTLPYGGFSPSCLFHYLILAGYFLCLVLVQFVLDVLFEKMRIGSN